MRCFAVNVFAPYRIAQTVVPRMRKRGGCFVHCLAAAAFTPILPALAYGCTKAALATMTQYFAKEFAPNIRSTPSHRRTSKCRDGPSSCTRPR